MEYELIGQRFEQAHVHIFEAFDVEVFDTLVTMEVFSRVLFVAHLAKDPYLRTIHLYVIV